MVTVELTPREAATVIAALRLWQMWQGDDVGGIGIGQAEQLEAVADEHGAGLTNDEIDVLIMERINV